MSKRNRHNPEFKAGVALEALKGEHTAFELAARFGVHPTMIHQWQRALLESVLCWKARQASLSMAENPDKCV